MELNSRRSRYSASQGRCGQQETSSSYQRKECSSLKTNKVRPRGR